MIDHRVWTLARFARSLIGSALHGPLRATLREALRFVGTNWPVRCRLRSISLRCYVMARSAVLSADTRRLRAAPLARSLPLPICRLRASPCRAEGAKGAHPPYQVCCPLAVLLKQNRMRRPSLIEAARARLRPSVGLLSQNAIGGAVPANPGVRNGRRQGHRLVCPNRKVKTNHPDILAVRVNPGARNGRSRGRLTLSPNRKVKTPNPPATPSPPTQTSEAAAGGDGVASRWPRRSRPSLRYASMRMVAALQSPGSRRSVAPHRLCAPLPLRYSPALPRGCNRPPGPHSAAAPSGDSHPLPSAPLGLPLCLWIAVTRPPLRSGRDTSPWFAPSPSRPLTRTPGRRTASPSGRDRPVGRWNLNPAAKRDEDGYQRRLRLSR